MNVTIRNARTDDVPALEILRRQSIESAFSGGYDREAYTDLVAGADERLPRWVESDEHLVVVAATAVTLVSYAAFDRGRSSVSAVFTNPAYGREGFGSAVLDRIEERARADGHATVRAVAPEPTVGFFEARGYEAGDPDRWHGLPAVRLRKRLRES
jgi:GNAT superfamily N-acetyltransferase